MKQNIKISTKTSWLNSVRSIFKTPVLERWIRSKSQGKPASNFYSKLCPNNYQYKSDTFRSFSYEDIHLKVDISDYVGHYLYFGFEDNGQSKLIELAKPGFTVLDIGTNIGATLLQFSNKVGENGKVYGFEPDKINFQACKTNIELNNFSNLQVENIGLGNEKGSFRLNVDTIDNRGRNRIKFDGNDNKNTTKIQVEKLDNWISTKNIQKIDLIKIDVEGFELKVLQGGEKTIKATYPYYLLNWMTTT